VYSHTKTFPFAVINVDSTTTQYVVKNVVNYMVVILHSIPTKCVHILNIFGEKILRALNVKCRVFIVILVGKIKIRGMTPIL